MKRSVLIEKIVSSVIEEILNEKERSRSRKRILKEIVTFKVTSEMIRRAKEVAEKIKQRYVNNYSDRIRGTLVDCRLENNNDLIFEFIYQGYSRSCKNNIKYEMHRDMLSGEFNGRSGGFAFYLTDELKEIVLKAIAEINPESTHAG